MLKAVPAEAAFMFHGGGGPGGAPPALPKIMLLLSGSFSDDIASNGPTPFLAGSAGGSAPPGHLNNHAIAEFQINFPYDCSISNAHASASDAFSPGQNTSVSWSLGITKNGTSRYSSLEATGGTVGMGAASVLAEDLTHQATVSAGDNIMNFYHVVGNQVLTPWTLFLVIFPDNGVHPYLLCGGDLQDTSGRTYNLNGNMFVMPGGDGESDGTTTEADAQFVCHAPGLVRYMTVGALNNATAADRKFYLRVAASAGAAGVDTIFATILNGHAVGLNPENFSNAGGTTQRIEDGQAYCFRLAAVGTSSVDLGLYPVWIESDTEKFDVFTPQGYGGGTTGLIINSGWNAKHYFGLGGQGATQNTAFQTDPAICQWIAPFTGKGSYMRSRISQNTTAGGTMSQVFENLTQSRTIAKVMPAGAGFPENAIDELAFTKGDTCVNYFEGSGITSGSFTVKHSGITLRPV